MGNSATLLDDPLSHELVVEANIVLHSAAASTYDSEPHFRAESKDRVLRQLRQLVPNGGKRLLDLGCGTGFLTEIADGLFSSTIGVDATPAMIDVARSKNYRSDVAFQVADVLAVDLPADSFDMVAGYAFLHHMREPGAVIARAAQWVRPGGVLYFDLEPNKEFWDRLHGLDTRGAYSAAIQRELRSISGQSEAEQYGIDEETFAAAEYSKKVTGGINVADLRRACDMAGLVDFQPMYHWFVGEAALVGHTVGGDVETRSLVDAALQEALPLSGPLYKYVGFSARRP